MLQRPVTRYTKTRDGYVAFQVFGEGDVDVLFITSWLSNIDVMWDDPRTLDYFDRLSRFARVALFDKRGTGVSDPIAPDSLPTLEEWMDDAIAVLDAAGLESAAVIADGEGGPMALMLAATYPERVSGLVLVNTYARFARSDDYPIGMPSEARRKLALHWEQNWGRTAEILGYTAPSLAHDTEYRDWFIRYQRLAMAPTIAIRCFEWVMEIDVRGVLASVHAPTLVIGRSKARHHRPEFGRYLADRLPNSRFDVHPGADTFPLVAGDYRRILDEIQEFLTGNRGNGPSGRQLATVVMTDIVGSTKHLAEMGDQQWADTLRNHDRALRDLLRRHRGEEVDHTGDGMLLIFDGPTRAVAFAAEATRSIEGMGVSIRVGIHTGEIERDGRAVRGLAVHIVSRVCDLAAAGEVAVTQTVVDLVLGSRIEFEAMGSHELRGIPGDWSIHKVATASRA